MGKRKKIIKKGRESRVEDRRELSLASPLKPYFIVFIASACGLVIEIVAARILAPTIGVSLYTWTGIIGVVLAGISIGNYLGGRLADRFPSATTLGLILLGGGVFSLSVLPLVDLVSEAGLALPIVARIVFMTATLFLLPSLILGMVSPVVIKLRLRDLAHTGNVVGRIYAVSTTGSIFGTFITGFVLIQWIGTRSTVLWVALVLVVMALAFGNLWRVRVPALACLAIFLVLGGFTIANRAWGGECLRESNYYCIRVDDIEEEGQEVTVLRLDALAHSYVCLEDPTVLVYSYGKVLADIATYLAQGNPSLRVLFIGGGGYTLPRYLEVIYPQSTLEVIEIDPEVTRVAFDYLALSPDTRIVTYPEDARMVVPKLPEGQYDLVVGDAFNDLSVPYHLTTREFNEQLRVLLKDDGIYAVNVVDKLHSGSFLRAYVNTLQQTFPYVYVVHDSPVWEDDSRTPHLVVGSLQPLSSAALSDASTQAGRGRAVSLIMPEDTFTSWLNARGNVLLTDDYAPVDNLVAPLHLEKFALEQAKGHYDAGVELGRQEKWAEAIAEYDETIRLASYLAEAYNNRGTAYANLEQFERAIQDFDEAIRLDPQLADAYNNRGFAYDSLGQHQRAIEDFGEAIRIDSQHAEAYYNRGTAYSTLEQFERAIQDFGEAIRLDPQYADAYARRALVHTLLNMDAEAQQDFDRAVTLGVDSSLLQAYIEKFKEKRQR